MAINFRKKKKILPGVYLNFSKTGISTTIGPRGANVNFGKKGVFLNTGIPGTGLYSRKRIGGGNGNKPPTNNFTSNTSKIKSVKSKKTALLLALFLGAFGAHHFYLRKYRQGILSILFFWTLIPAYTSLFSFLNLWEMSKSDFDEKYNNITSLEISKEPTNDFHSNNSFTPIPTSQSLEELKKHIEEARQEREEIVSEIEQQQTITWRLESNLKNKQNVIRSLFIKKKTLEKLQQEVKEANEYLTDLYSQYEGSQANINIESDKDFQEQYKKVKDTYVELSKADKIWDIVSERTSFDTKSAAKTTIERKEVSFTFDNIDFILSEHSAFNLGNADGDNLYIYPAFIMQLSHSGAITLIDLHELRFRFYKKRFLEEDSTMPNDTQVVDYTWERVNKDGSRDKRFSDNNLISIVEYGAFEFSTNSGLREVYYISNVQLAEKFANEFRKYLSFLTPTTDFSIPEKIVPNSNRTKSKDFSYQYYSLLKDFSGLLSKIVYKLHTNDAILERLSGLQVQMGQSDFISRCVAFDMIQIFNILTDGKLSLESLEATGLALATNQVFLDSSEDIFDMDFDTLATAHQQGLYQNTVRQLLDFGKKDNPFKLSIDQTKNEEIISSTKLQIKLSLSTFLKFSDSPLFDDYATTLYRYATIISKADNVVTESEEALLKEIYQITHNPIPEKKNDALSISKGDKNETLDEVLNELNSLIGLKEVKAEINTLINFIKVQKARKQSGLKSSSLSYHIVFTGNPGTGKTTVARIIAKIYKHLGILTEGQLVETDRSGLVAEYVGQTAVKVNKTVNSALNGILFIDEAYSLVGENKDDFGKEAVATLIKRMEDDRDKLVLILAGYTNEMSDFIDTNPGFKSRFNRYINFPDFSPSELFEIFESNCKKLDYQLTKGAKEKLKTIIETAYSKRDKSFGNGRFIRNIFEKSIEQQANRIAKESHLTKEILLTITEEDITNVSVSIYSQDN